MPDAAAWRHIAAAGDIDATIQRMRDNGLARWVGSLPRSPDALTLEQTLTEGAVSLVREVRNWLPKDCRTAFRSLHEGVAADEVLNLDRRLRAFTTLPPSGSGRGAYVLARLTRLAGIHLADIRAERLRIRRMDDPAELDVDAQWRLREKLSRDLHALLGGYPFHAGFFLIYVLLELLQLERCRALLVARAYGWDATGVV